jgi:hypothetical protein
MKKHVLKLLVISIGVLVFSFSAEAVTLKLTDFDSGRINDFGGGMGAWNKDPADTTQGCFEMLDTEVKRGNKGASLRLEYDVDSPNPAYNGFWTKLEGRDLSDYNAISFWVKGDPDAGYTTRFKIELKNEKGQAGRFIVTGVTDEWTQVVVPFKNFKGISDFSEMSEFVIVFDDVLATSKEGIIYIDDVVFTTATQ